MNISLKLSKCAFGTSNVDYLGYELSKDGVKPQAGLTEAITDFATPESKKGMKRFIGKAGFYRNFIPQFADICKTLHELGMT